MKLMLVKDLETVPFDLSKYKLLIGNWYYIKERYEIIIINPYLPWLWKLDSNNIKLESWSRKKPPKDKPWYTMAKVWYHISLYSFEIDYKVIQNYSFSYKNLERIVSKNHTNKFGLPVHFRNHKIVQLGTDPKNGVWSIYKYRRFSGIPQVVGEFVNSNNILDSRRVHHVRFYLKAYDISADIEVRSYDSKGKLIGFKVLDNVDLEYFIKEERKRNRTNSLSSSSRWEAERLLDEYEKGQTERYKEWKYAKR